MSSKDEPLIITEVDRLITTISEHKRITLEDLQRICKIDKKSTDKWVRVLEDEGYVNIEYKLGATYIVWKTHDEGVAQETTSVVSEPQSEQVRKVEEVNDSQIMQVNEAEIQKNEEATPEINKENNEQTTPNNIPQSYEEEKTIVQVSKPNEEFKIKTTFQEKEAEEKVVQNTQNTESIVQKIAAKEIRENQDNKEMEEEIKTPTIEPQTRDIIAQYINEINSEKEQISKYKREKQTLYQERIATLEGKVEADIGAITELILQKQSKIAKIKGQISKIPQEMDQLNSVQQEIVRAKEEAQKTLNRIRNRTEIILDEIKENKNEMDAKVTELEAKTQNASERIERIKGADRETLMAINTLEERATEIEKVSQKLNENLGEIRREIKQAKETRAELKEESNEIQDEIMQAQESVDSLKEEIEEIDQSQEMLDKYMGEYQKRVNELEKYVNESEEEFAQLKEAAETHYLKGYANELEKMAEAYSGELSEIIEMEENIDAKISKSKKRVIELIKNSQEIMEKLNEMNSSKKDFSLSQRAIKKRIEMIKSTPAKEETIETSNESEDDDSDEPSSEKMRIGRFEKKGPVFSSAAKRIISKKDKK